MIFDIITKYKYGKPIQNKNDLINLFDTLLSLSFNNELNKQKQKDLKSLIKELGIDERILEKNANTIKQAIIDKINELDPKI